MIYPFEPRTTRDLAQGHFWGVPLHDGRYSAGVMLAHVTAGPKRDSAKMLVGLLDWVSVTLPSSADLINAKIWKKAFVHVRAVESCGSRSSACWSAIGGQRKSTSVRPGAPLQLGASWECNIRPKCDGAMRG